MGTATYFLAVCIVACSVISQAERMVVPFRYSWRFHYGPGYDDAPGPGTCSFTPIDTSKCTNMEYNPNRFTADDCRISCCYNPACFVWSSAGKSCLWGGADTICPSSTNVSADVTGGIRKAFQPPKEHYQFSVKDFDDSSWQLVDVPHDSLVNGTFTDSDDTHHGFLPRNVSWYRKHFTLPVTKTLGAWHLEFEGTFHYTQIWINGQHVMDHELGYSPYSIRLDNLTGILVPGEPAVIALRTDASYGSGHWYEGGGIRWDVNLVWYPSVHIARFGAFVVPQVTGASPSGGIEAKIEVSNDGAAAVAAPDYSIKVLLTTLDGATSVAACTAPGSTKLLPSTTTIVHCSLHPTSPLKLWSIQSPTQYLVNASVRSAASGMDSVSWATGFRTAEFSADNGLSINGKQLKFRGFSHHDSFAGCGVAMPPRIDLYRAQAGRAVGSNVWRMSHNPYHRPLYDILDALGTTVWDENRDLGPWYVDGMGTMVKRDRNHPSILLWSFCNEFECGQNSNQTGIAFRAASLAEDTSRPLTSNVNGHFIPGVDVQGFSHRNLAGISQFHQDDPLVPTVLSECCSCTSHRLPISDRSPTSSCIRQQNSPGLATFVTGSLGVWTLFDYFGESHTWPDYACAFGQFDIAGSPKPHAYWYVVNWLQLAHDSGRPPLQHKDVVRLLDLPDQLQSSGHGNGLTCSVSGISTGTANRLFVNGVDVGTQQVSEPGSATQWDVNSPLYDSDEVVPGCNFSTNLSGLIQCKGLTSDKQAKSAQACEKACCDAQWKCNVWQYNYQHGCWFGLVDIQTQCAPNPKSGGHWVGAGNGNAPVPTGCAAKNLTMEALDASGKVIGRHTLLSPVGNTVLTSSVDVPSVSTGTGSKLLLDGIDTGIVRITLGDTTGSPVTTTENATNVTFEVVSGPGRILGVGSGDPAAHTPQQGVVCATYAGTAKALVQVTVDCVSPGRSMLATVDSESGKRTKIVPEGTSCDSEIAPIIVKASALHGGRELSVTAEINVSSDPEVDGVLAVARASVTDLDFALLDTFQG